MDKWRPRLFGFVEYALAALFIHGGIDTFFNADPAYLPGIFAILVGEFAIYFYGMLFVFVGLLLLYGKLLKKKKPHKHALLMMYLICTYVLVLAIAISGFNFGLLLTVVVGILSASLWLRWKFQTEYISLSEFRHEHER